MLGQDWMRMTSLLAQLDSGLYCVCVFSASMAAVETVVWLYIK